MVFLPAELSQDPTVFQTVVSVYALVLNRFIFPWACFCLPLKTWYYTMWPAISSDYMHASQKTSSVYWSVLKNPQKVKKIEWGTALENLQLYVLVPAARWLLRQPKNCTAERPEHLVVKA